MNIIFLMKPLSTVVKGKDTSLLFMQACEELGGKLYYLAQNDASITTQGVEFSVTPFSCNQKSNPKLFTTYEKKVLHESEVHSVFIRTDPPFDQRYLNDMWVLEQVRFPVNFVNHPKGIREVNEKIWASQFKEIIPETCIASNKEQLQKFINIHKKIILKPTDGFGGEAICILDINDPNKNVLFEMLTRNYSNYIIAQKYIKEADRGDKRILLVDGEPMAAILRCHSENDHRNNFFAGGTAKLTTITKNDEKIINEISNKLTKLGLRFVGLDIIGDYLIEVNVTSPTCLQEYNNLNSTKTHLQIIKKLLNL